MPKHEPIPGHHLLPRRERRLGARLLLWATVVTALSGAAVSALHVIAIAGRML
ncbi:MAG TPA: hypothetical protein VK501_20695 [Baekduia sp.]|uniref:hypothetical protein n=1 Tax=Baekduia sp. TaxID=2600305 RepID=UPI002D0FC62D|nr:hypothetical protein [Baekduia sp.]HMJ36333.1 hypothetical protein [Baekduia sp.]